MVFMKHRFTEHKKVIEDSDISEISETTNILIKFIQSSRNDFLASKMASQIVPDFVQKYGDSKNKLDRAISRCKTAKSNLYVCFDSSSD